MAETLTESPLESIDLPAQGSKMDYHALNALLNFYDADGLIQFDKDKQAAREYHLEHVNKKVRWFTDFEERITFLLDNDYYERALFELYPFEFIKALTKDAYSRKYRFATFMGAFKFYTSYAMKDFDGDMYLERIEDRIVMTALLLARGDQKLAQELVEEMITNRLQPATPTFLNAGKAQRGELVSCFLLRTEDNMESIARSSVSSLQLSKRGGGVAVLLTNIRETGAPIKKIKGQSGGIIPWMKGLENDFSSANQLGARQGAGAVYLHAFHPDIMLFLDTKRENADEKIRIKTLSLGVVVPDIAFELAAADEDMYLPSPYDIERIYGTPMSDIDFTAKYREIVGDARITKKKINARKFFETLAAVQFESGYPYILFEDTANRANAISGRINMSNLCSEILQVNTASTMNDDLSYTEGGIGKDISCNLASMNVALAMDGPSLGRTVEIAIRGLSAVSDLSDITSVPTVRNGNKLSHAIGLGQMNLAGYFGREEIQYDSKEAVDFTNIYFYTVTYHAVLASSKIAQETGETFDGFEKSHYADGRYFDKYVNRVWEPATEKVRGLFERSGQAIPTQEDWKKLARRVAKYGIYNQNLQAVPPTGSISYINNSTASIHPIIDKVETRKEGKTGRVFVPAPYLTNDNKEFFPDAYEVGPQAIINIYAAAGNHVDQGLSMTLFFKSDATTREVNRAQISAWLAGVKSTYYMRIRKLSLDGMVDEGCVSCAL